MPAAQPARDQHIAVVASGVVPAAGLDAVGELLGQADLVIAADGGLAHCVAVGVWPHIVVGDLDSADPGELVAAREQGANVRVAAVDKDETDLELALLAAVAAGATKITVVGAFGGRIDHELANVALLASARWQPCAVGADDGVRQMWVVRDLLTLNQPIGTTLSLLPWHGPARGVTSTGVRWPLTKDVLGAGTPRGVSNVASQAKQTITVAGGALLVIVDRTESGGRSPT